MQDLKSLVRFFRGVKTASELTEEFLLSQLNSNNRHTLWAATIALRQNGTSRSVAALKECCLRPIRDIQVTSLFTLQAIDGRGIADFSASLLAEKEYRQKWAAMIVSCEVCNEIHRQVLEKRVKEATSRKRACPEVGGLNGKTTEVLHFINYLARTGQPIGDVRGVLLRRRELLTNQEILALEAAS